MTDANVVLGHLPPRLLGGEMELDVEAARAAVQTIADAMGLDSAEEAAEGIVAIVNENMAGALRLVSVQRGHDPREFALVAYGGAGPAARERHGEADGLLPGDRPAGARACSARSATSWPTSATSSPRRTSAWSSDADGPEVASILDDLGERATEWLDGRGDRAGGARRHLRRRHALPPAGLRDPGRARPRRDARDGLGELEERFNGLHEQLYGFRMPGTASEIVNLRAVGFGVVPKPELPTGELGAGDASGAVVDEHDDRLRRRARARRRSTTARSSTPGAVLRRPGDRDRVRLDDASSCPGYGRRSTRASTS